MKTHSFVLIGAVILVSFYFESSEGFLATELTKITLNAVEKLTVAAFGATELLLAPALKPLYKPLKPKIKKLKPLTVLGRKKRDAQSIDLEEVILEASIQDADDCLKSFVCQLNSKSAESLSPLEKVWILTFGQNDIDVTLPTIEFDVAAVMGRKAGVKQCHTIYSRCQTEYEVLDSFLKSLESKYLV